MLLLALETAANLKIWDYGGYLNYCKCAEETPNILVHLKVQSWAKTPVPHREIDNVSESEHVCSRYNRRFYISTSGILLRFLYAVSRAVLI